MMVNGWNCGIGVIRSCELPLMISIYEIVTLTNFESRTIDNLFGNRLVSTLSQVKLII